MISFKLENLFAIDSSHSLTEKELQDQSAFLKTYLSKIKNRKQGFYTCIDDQSSIQKIKDYASKNKGQFKDIIILGIGGSALGAICLQQSLKHLFENELKNSSTPPLHVLDNIDPVLIREIEDIIDFSSTLFIVVTKSGGTPETLSQYFYFRAKTDEHKLDPTKHFVFITDPQKGFLRKMADEEKIPSFAIPENVGGRFSVLTAVGLLPAALIDIDIEKLLIGARSMRNKFLSPDSKINIPFQIASIQYLLNKKGKDMTVLMPYSQKLIRFTDWYRQLLSESIGKTDKIGLTPISALGATDQHSQLQLYNDGPNDKLFIFIEVENLGTKVIIPNIYPKNTELDFLKKNISFNQLIQIEKDATTQSLTKNSRPNLTIKINQINEENLGELFMLFEAATAFLGEMFNINAFDQPGVELSKKLTKEALLKL